MKILVTGGAGFIGSHVVETYLASGHEVVVVDNLSTGRRENLPLNCKFYQTSLSDPALKNIIEEEKPEVVNHHAAQIDIQKSISDPAHDAEINIVGTLNLLEASRKSGTVKKFVLASTGGAIYGEQDIFPADENHRANPVNPYGISKLTIENYLRFYWQNHKIPFVALRYGNVYGPRQNDQGDAGVIAIFIHSFLRHKNPTIFGDGEQTRDYIFVKDVAQCSVAALSPKSQGIFNVGTGIETSVNQLAKYLIGLCKVDLAPKFGLQRPGEQKRSCIKPGALQKMPPTSLLLGLEETVDWFRKNLSST